MSPTDDMTSSLERIRSECAQVASLLQPYVDEELSGDEARDVASHLGGCGPCRAAVAEQAWVRQTLAGLEPTRAPGALRAQVLLALDEEDRSAAASAPARPSPWGGLRRRLAALARGSAVMVPAGAVAALLLVAAQRGWLPGTAPDQAPVVAANVRGLPPAPSPEAQAEPGEPDARGDQDLLATLSALEPKVGFPVQAVRPDPGSVELVAARLDPGRAGTSDPPGARLEYVLSVAGRGLPPVRVVDVQVPAGRVDLPGTRQVFRGRSYHLNRDVQGRAYVQFTRDQVVHAISLVGSAEPRRLRALARAIASAHPADEHESTFEGPLAHLAPDQAVLLLIADHLAHAAVGPAEDPAPE